MGLVFDVRLGGGGCESMPEGGAARVVGREGGRR